MMLVLLRNLLSSIVDLIIKIISQVEWPQTSSISEEDKAKISEYLKYDYYIICTRHRNYLSTYLVAIADFLLTGRWSYYAHVLMNLEDSVTAAADFRLVEAIPKGVTYSPFSQVFGGADGVCILKPANMSVTEWTSTLDAARNYLGRSYDTLYDLANDQNLSCVELVRNVLMTTPNYSNNFANFEAMIAKSKNLTPQMFRDCPDFEVVLELKR